MVFSKTHHEKTEISVFGKSEHIYFFNLIYYRDSLYKMYKDKLQNCSWNQFHYIVTYKQVETNSMTKNRGGNNGSEKW
jgi:hypothetical protein